MKYAVIGTNWITDAFIEGTLLSGRMELAAVYSRTLARAIEFGQPYDCDAVFDDLYKMAEESGFDAVYIASPNSLHYEQSKLFLEMGKHVLCEKPIAACVEEYEELSALAERKGLIYMEAIMMMHHPFIGVLKKTLDRLGAITTARLDFSQLSSKYDALAAGETPNIFNPAFAAGCLMDMGPYCLYPAIDWFGYPREIIARAGIIRTGADGYVNGVLIYPDKQVLVSLSKTGQSRIGSEIMGDAGTISIESLVLMTGVWFTDRKGNRERVIEDLPRAGIMGAEADDFCRYVGWPGQYRDEYRHMKETALQVARASNAIKRAVAARV